MVVVVYLWYIIFYWFGIVGIVYVLVLIIFFCENEEYVRVIWVMYIDKLKKILLFKGVIFLFGNIVFWIILFYFVVFSFFGWVMKNWLFILYVENFDIFMVEVGFIFIIMIVVFFFIGVILGGLLLDCWVFKDICGCIYIGVIGLGLIIFVFFLLGLGNGFISIIGVGFLFGVGFGMFDVNNMFILC